MESQIDKQEYTASAQSRARDGTGGINQPSNVCGLDIYLKKKNIALNKVPNVLHIHQNGVHNTTRNLSSRTKFDCYISFYAVIILQSQ